MNAQHYSRETNWNAIARMKEKSSIESNRQFTFLWKNGSRQRIFCDSPQQAIVSLGICSVDFENRKFKIIEGESDGYYWCNRTGHWKHHDNPDETMIFQ